MIKLNVDNLFLDFDCEDKEYFYKFWDKFLNWKGEATITPLYSDNGELMSFIVDSKKADNLLKNHQDK